MGYQTLVTYEEGQDTKQNSEARGAVALVDEREIRETVRMQVNVSNPYVQNYVRKTVASLCRRRSLHGAEEDIVQDVFRDAMTTVLRGEAAIETVLYTIAHNECENERRRRRRQPPIKDPTEEQPDPLSE